MGVYMSLSTECDERAAIEIESFIKGLAFEQGYYITSDITEGKGKIERDMQWETMKQYQEKFDWILEEEEKYWDELADIIIKHKLKISISSMFEATSSDDIYQQHIDEIHKELEGMTDEEIDAEGRVRFIAQDTYWYNEKNEFKIEISSEDLQLDIML